MRSVERSGFLATVVLLAPLGGTWADDLDERILALDGRITAAELSAAPQRVEAHGAEMVVAQDDHWIWIGVRSEPLYVVSLCVAVAADRILVLHASAALGQVVYRAAGERWSTDGAFSWQMRDPSMNEEALAERRAYLEREKWLATTQEMGRDGETEILMRRDLLGSAPIRIAAGLMPASDPTSILALPPAAKDGCADRELVAGEAPATLLFAPDAWPTLAPSEGR